MRRVFVLLGLWFFAASSLALAAPLQQECAGVAISSPRDSGDPVRGKVSINGSASIANFQFYKVEFAPGNNPADTSFHNMAADVHRSAVPNGLLDVWDTTGLPDGPYTLRLTVVDIRGNFPCPPIVVRSVIVANRTVVATATPIITATVTISLTVVASPVAAASATRAAAPTIQLPTTAPRSTLTSTTTTTVTDTTTAKPLINFDFLPDLLNAVSWGVVGMGAVLGLSGVYVALRWVMDHI
jgi:hypothetical protein